MILKSVNNNCCNIVHYAKDQKCQISPEDNKYASKYSPGKYLLVANANTKGVGEGTEFPLTLQ